MPGWTDHNQHDPGVTVLEVLAWPVAAFCFALGVFVSRRRRERHTRRLP